MAWIIFDNVYARTGRHHHPGNASVVKARAAGFDPEGGRRDAAIADEFWGRAVRLWGDPRGSGAVPSDSPPPAPPVAVTGVPAATGEPSQPANSTSRGPANSVPALAEEALNGTRQLWESLRGKYPFHGSGFAVFYSPLSESSKLVIIGANPGGGANSFNLARATAIPTEHDYFAYDYALARRMRDLFTAAGRLDLLRSSLKLNLNFFRSRDANEWRTAPADTRRLMEAHSQRWVLSLLERLSPSLVLCEGTSTFDRLRDVLPGAGPSKLVVEAAGGRRAYVRASTPWGGTLIGVIHPTGAQVSTDDWGRIASALAQDVLHL
ncbi:MAG: hypothetical protein HY875_14375 [Chloroflexi bacterium]|nr:hypothetical protein [Chloroflexota bacterium]